MEPSSTWHQNVSAEDPYIYHYTFGVEYAADGIPVVGRVGEWSLDKRHYFGGYPPMALADPPKCAQECAWLWSSKFNEATAALSAEGQSPQLVQNGPTSHPIPRPTHPPLGGHCAPSARPSLP